MSAVIRNHFAPPRVPKVIPISLSSGVKSEKRIFIMNSLIKQANLSLFIKSFRLWWSFSFYARQLRAKKSVHEISFPFSRWNKNFISAFEITVEWKKRQQKKHSSVVHDFPFFLQKHKGKCFQWQRRRGWQMLLEQITIFLSLFTHNFSLP